MIDAVLSYHADPISCGVTKFSQQLAKRLDVPWVPLNGFGSGKHPLLSIKHAELHSEVVARAPYDLFLHDYKESALLYGAERVFAASEEIANRVRATRSVIPAWCPSLMEAHPREPITVLSFGMAHKLSADLYATLKDKLDATGEPYVVYVSAALHDGTSFSDAAQSFETLRQLFGMNFVFLGTLSDEAMVDRLRTCTYVAAFFENGLRENNTSVMAAIDYGAIVLTNYDSDTPGPLQCVTHDVNDTKVLPHVGRRNLLRHHYGWDKLIELIKHA